jgi:hypothetical protein
MSALVPVGHNVDVLRFHHPKGELPGAEWGKEQPANIF